MRSSTTRTFPTALLPAAPGLGVDHADLQDAILTVYLRATARTACCPQCQQPAHGVHSRYTRTAADLPWAGAAVRLVLAVRKFFCRNRACTQRIFAERLPTMVAARARSTVRLTTVWRLVAFALGGEAGARLLDHLRMPTSPDTLLSLIRQTVPVAHPTPRVLGIDEWAMRKGQTYGTILVDGERHQVVDLLPDRTADTVTAWLHVHPGVEIISRDRWDAYAAGATKGAPQAVQVADRWHLVTNVGNALERLLTRHTSALRQAARETSGAPIDDALPTPPPAPPPPRPRPSRPRKMPALSAQRVWQLAMYQQVRDLTAQGWSRQAIMDHLHIDKATVRKYRTSPRSWMGARPPVRR